MQRTLVESSNVVSIGYDAETETLEVEFHSGNVYQYRDVPEVVFRDFMSTSSKGRFFSQDIRGQYPHSQVA